MPAWSGRKPQTEFPRRTARFSAPFHSWRGWIPAPRRLSTVLLPAYRAAYPAPHDGRHLHNRPVIHPAGNPACGVSAAGQFSDFLHLRQQAECLIEVAERKGLCEIQRCDRAENLADLLGAADAAAGASGHIAAALFQPAKRRADNSTWTSNPPWQASVISIPRISSADSIMPSERKNRPQNRRGFRAGHHHHMGDTVVHQGNRRLFCDPVIFIMRVYLFVAHL